MSQTTRHSNNTPGKPRSRAALLVGAALFAVIVGAALYLRHPASASIAMHSDGSPIAPSAPEPPTKEAKFLPTIANVGPVPDGAPRGMVWIPGGEFSMGAQDPPDMNEVGMQAPTDSRPIHRVYVGGISWTKPT
jgi:formylglycine-generating enzyme